MKTTARFISLAVSVVIAHAAAAIECVDISGETARHSVVAAGTTEVFNGQPSTTLLPDGKTMFCFWTINHGGRGGPAARSDDGGRTWSRIDSLMPEDLNLFVECPMVHRLVDSEGHARLWAWYGFKARNEQEAQSLGGKSAARIAAAQTTAAMPSVMSEDGGVTWQEMQPLGEKFCCILSFQGIVQMPSGSYLGVFHRGAEACVDRSPLEVLSSTTSDGGLTWTDPKVIAAVPGLDLCEPWVFRSPDGKELAVLMRENTRKGRSKVIFSTDEGATWTVPQDVPDGLTGDRHQGVVLKDGRLVVCFRDMEKDSPTWGHYVAWIGPYTALHGQASGNIYKVKLFHSFAGSDCGYSGVHLLPDDTIVCTTYVKYRNDDCRQSVMTTRFKVSETDAMRSASGGSAAGSKSAPIPAGSVQPSDPSTKYTSLHYVQDGLVAQWDGVENVGRFRHAESFSQWKDLVGDGTISLASGVATTGANYVKLLDNKQVNGECSGLTNDVPMTIEVCARCVSPGSSQGCYVFCNGSHKFICAKSTYYQFTYDDASHRVYMKGLTIDTSEAHTFSCSYPGDDLSVSYDGKDVTSKLVEESRPEVPKTCDREFHFGTTGRSGSYEYYSIRIYSRLLTAEEIRHNHEIDVARFKEGQVGLNDMLFVGGTPELLGTVSPAYGSYANMAAGTQVDCSARSAIPIGQTNSTCAGYVVYTNGAYGAGQEYLHGSESSFRYVQPSNAIAELVWQWDMREDPTLPNVIDVTAESANPDELVVGGNLAAMSGAKCDLSVVVSGGGLAEPLVFERLAGSERTEPGAFELRVVTDDPDAARYLRPGVTYEVRVLAKAGEKCSQSVTKLVKMYREDISSASYVQRGLASQWDGKENNGRGEHASSLDEWKDLVGSGFISTASGVATIGADYVKLLDNKQMNGECPELANDTPKTIEVYARCVSPGGSQGCYVFCNDSHKFIHAQSTYYQFTYDDASHRVYMKGLTIDTSEAHTFSCSYPGSAVLVSYDGDDITSQLVEEQRPDKPRACGSAFHFGTTGRTGSYEYHSIRIYSRMLTQGEIRQNRWIDQIRYDGGTVDDVLPTGTRMLADGTIQYRTEIDAHGAGVRFCGTGEFAEGRRTRWKSLPTAMVEAVRKDGWLYAWVGAPKTGAVWTDGGATMTWDIDGAVSLYLDAFEPSASVRHIAPGRDVSFDSLAGVDALHIGSLSNETDAAICRLCAQVEVTAANGGYAIVETKTSKTVKGSKFTLLNGGTLKLLADATIHDLEMPDEADALDLNGHTLTICSTAHRNRKGWKGQVIGDESQIVWKGMGFALILK